MSSYPEYYFMRYILRVFIGISLMVFSQQTFASEKSSLELVRPAQQRLEALREKVSETLLRPIKPSRLSQNNAEAKYPTGGSSGPILSVSMSPRLSVAPDLERFSKRGRRISYRHQSRMCRIYKKCRRTLKVVGGLSRFR